jgi:uncharacterized membrane protein YfcA
MVSVPILALIDPALAPVPQLLVTFPLTVSMAWRERDHLALRGLGWVVAGRLGGAALGVGLLAWASQQALELAIAILVLAAALIIAFGLHVRKTPRTQFGAGMFSGVSGLVASIGGPPLALLYTRDEGAVVRSNLATVFVIGISITIVARIISGNMSWQDVQIAAILLPALAAGYLLSLLIKDVVPRAALRTAIIALSVLGATGLLLRTWIS